MQRKQTCQMVTGLRYNESRVKMKLTILNQISLETNWQALVEIRILQLCKASRNVSSVEVGRNPRTILHLAICGLRRGWMGPIKSSLEINSCSHLRDTLPLLAGLGDKPGPSNYSAMNASFFQHNNHGKNDTFATLLVTLYTSHRAQTGGSNVKHIAEDACLALHIPLSGESEASKQRST